MKQTFLLTVLVICRLTIQGGNPANPYHMMGCETPVLDYDETLDTITFCIEFEKTKTTPVIMLVDEKSIVMLSSKSDTVSIFKNDGINLLMFVSVDRLGEDNPQCSPYAYCFGNPISYVDPDGLKPTKEEAARMAHYVYQDESVTLTGGWVASTIKDYNFKKTNGLKTMLFERKLADGKIEYALAFAGTDTSNIFSCRKDAIQDVRQLFGLSSQYADAMDMSKEFVQSHDEETTFVGHSLGGGLSAASAFATSGQAITFNAAWVSPFTRYENEKADIDAYITKNDPLDSAQQKIGVRANGNIIVIDPKSDRDGHTITNFY